MTNLSSSVAASNPVLRGMVWMLLSSALYAATFVSIREMTEVFHVFQVTLFRALLGTLFMLPWLMKAGIGALRTARWKTYASRLAVTYTGMVCWFYGLANIPLADATALLFTTPLFTVLMVALWQKEPVGLARWTAIFAGFGGALIIIRPGLIEVTLPVLLLIYTAVAYGASNAFTKSLTTTEDPNRVVFYMFALVIPVAAVPSAMVWTPPTWDHAPLILIFGLLSWGSMSSLTRSLALAPASVVMPLFYLQLPFVAIIAYALFNETPHFTIWIGGAIIAASGYYIAWSQGRDTKKTRDTAAS